MDPNIFTSLPEAVKGRAIPNSISVQLQYLNMPMKTGNREQQTLGDVAQSEHLPSMPEAPRFDPSTG